MRDAWFCCVGVLGGCAALLVATNPGPAQFERYAADQAVQRISREVCDGNLQSWIGLVSDNCQELVTRHRQDFERLIGQHTRRVNLGLVSLYRTRVSTRELLPSLPAGLDYAYELRTLGLLGHFQLIGQES